MLVTNILTCLLIILVGILLYIVTLTDKVFKQVRQRAYDNFALSHKNSNDIKALEDRTKQLSNRINNQLELINDNDDDVRTLFRKKLKAALVAGYGAGNKKAIRALEDRVEKNEIALGLKKDYPNLTFLPPKDWRR